MTILFKSWEFYFRIAGFTELLLSFGEYLLYFWSMSSGLFSSDSNPVCLLLYFVMWHKALYVGVTGRSALESMYPVKLSHPFYSNLSGSSLGLEKLELPTEIMEKISR